MVRVASLLAVALLLGACSDDAKPPPGDGAVPDGPRVDVRREWRAPWDGFDPKCPLAGPCVLGAKGQGKHAAELVVIGEVVTLTGRELQAVDAVWIGGEVAPLLAASATSITCRVGVRTPGGDQSIEVKAGSSRRKFWSLLAVRRLLALAAVDDTKVITLDAATHGAGAVLELAEAPRIALSVSLGGRYLIAQGATQLLVVDLAAEATAAVDGLAGETVTSWTTDSEDRTLLVATASGKLLAADLASFSPLTAKPTTAPGTAAVQGFGAGQVVGLHPTHATGEGSAWTAAVDLKAVAWAQQGSVPFVLGGGGLTAPFAAAAADGIVALLGTKGATSHVGVLSVTASALKGEGTLAASGAFDVAIAAGGGQVALSADGATLQLVTLAGVASSVSLGGATSRLLAVRLPMFPGVVGALVGSKPAGKLPFVAAALEIVDAAKSTRLAAGGKPALELADVRGAVGDPIAGVVHLVTGTAYRAFTISVSGATATTVEKHPNVTLPVGKDFRWIAVQP
jgi:hypothetical protein